MSFLIDILILLLIGAGLFAEVRRGLFFALSDIVRIVGGVAAGFAAYALFHRLFHTYAAGFVALAVAALAVVMLVPLALRLLKADPVWGKTGWARAAAGVIGLAIGLLIAAVFVPVIGRGGWGREAVPRSLLARPLLATAPVPYYIADALDLDFPMLNARAIRFEDEGQAEQAALVERINYSGLSGSTCIECRAAVKFAGYHRRFETAVSPKFVCPECGRTSDGCQTFEGFHKMYGRCPVDVAEALGPIDCGVWPNDRPVYPNGVCPVCGKATHR